MLKGFESATFTDPSGGEQVGPSVPSSRPGSGAGATLELEPVARLLSPRHRREKSLQSHIEEVLDRYECIIIDGPVTESTQP